ncbi:M20 family metallopeptidase [Amycolatopsis acidiphila]|uniref:M20 family metallopeptidase n=1 Tax=Amycolatopsis acidiphila TaxID=715473 RepID=A0A558AF29_9PSEU|nr:M20 family metallopeptidase [Amycolatopsis acidiphila]TVT22864.1 M20 family metallopeptidase [Amycolatopsis acidiphila]UIJ58124.1 M20 family metallopeptidase [Amycolatopsis acidiphila]GHG69919.1 peptidase M20 [Amycolatopsis acidiphila]
MTDVVALTRSLVGLDTIGHDETAALKVLAPLLEGVGFVVAVAEHEPGRGTLVAEWHTDLATPPLCLSGHVDTVPLGAVTWQHEPFGELDGDRLYGRGSSDMKGGVAAIVLAAVEIAAHAPKRAGLRLVLTSAEETGSLGARHAAETVLDEPSGPLVIAEPTSNAVVHGHKGAFWLEAVATGVTAHGSMPQLGDNAVYKLARAVSRLADHGFDARPHPIMGPPTFNVGTIEGGLNTNSVPDRAVATVDVRTVAGQDHAAVLAELAHVAGQEVELRPLVDLPPVWTDPDDEWARAAEEIVLAVTGERNEPRAATYFTDASVLTPAFGGVPTIICGPGEAEQAHVTDEWCSVTRLAQSVEIFERLCVRWCGI